MWYFYIISWVATVVQVCFIVCAIAAGLYYLAELVEEFTVMTGKVIRLLILITMALYGGFFVFEDLPTSLIVCGLLSQVFHLLLLQTFPVVDIASPVFIAASVLLVINHYLAFGFFGANYYAFSEVLAYFTLCLWIVPFAFVISLSANDQVLPTIAERQKLLGEDDVVSNYFSKGRHKKQNLLSFFQRAKDSVLPQRVKKGF